MKIVYAGQTPPKSFTKSIFLAGPSPRNDSQPNWRERALELLGRSGYTGVVFVPLPQDGKWPEVYTQQVDWELKYLGMADIILFWIPRQLGVLPAFTTNVEFGNWCHTGKVVLGYPPHADNMRYLDHLARLEKIPIADTLEETIVITLDILGTGARRREGEREVPLHIWKTSSFQSWYTSQVKAGNRLDGAKVVWTFRVGPTKQIVFFWALHVDIYIVAEDRHKTNEVVISRPDISSVVAFHPAASILETQVLLIREFRSPSRTADGCTHEVAGGSTWKPNTDPTIVASYELSEETGLTVDPNRIQRVASRQLVSTLSSHQAHCYFCYLTASEINYLLENAHQVHGVAQDTERTYTELRTLKQILEESQDVDWANLGMILSAILLNPEPLAS